MERNKEQEYQRAKDRVRELRKFYNHLSSYLVVITFLGALNYYSNGWSYMWFLWAVFGWGVGICFDAVKAFQLNPMFNKNWEERKIREFMEKEEFKERKQQRQRWE